MAAAFRKSLFGFNSDDVTSYITNMHKEHSVEVTELKEKIEDLSVQLKVSESNVKSLAAQNAELSEKLQVYIDKYDEIELLARNIGKLYVVANTNALAIMNAATENKDLSKTQVDKNLESVTHIQKTLISTREEIAKTVSEFSEKLDSLLTELSLAKSKIDSNDDEADEKIKSFEALVKNI